MTPIHRFSAYLQAPRNEWFARVVTTERWVEQPAGGGQDTVGNSESQPIRVFNPADDMAGVAKPGLRKGAEEICRAAHEKIAFDLAHVLGLPVPPVLLWSADMPAAYKRGRAISCWAFPQTLKWNEADSRNYISDRQKTSAAALVAMFRAFHTWIGDTDRKPDHLLVDLESPDHELRFAAIDHGFSMSYVWKDDGAPIQPCPNHLTGCGVPDDEAALAEALACIEALDEREIKRLVNRVPGAYLPDSERRYILSNLVARKTKLRAAFGL